MMSGPPEAAELPKRKVHYLKDMSRIGKSHIVKIEWVVRLCNHERNTQKVDLSACRK